MLKNRKKLLKGFLYIFLLICFGMMLNVQLIAKTIDSGTIKLAHSEPEIDIISTPYFALTSVFKDIVERETQGRFKVEIYPTKQLGDLRSMMEQCARGVIEMTTGQNSGLLSSYYPDIQAFDIPYLFRNTEIGRRVLSGPFGQKMTKEIIEASGLRVLAYFPSALRNFANNVKEIRTPDDMKGLKIRTMEIPIHMKLVSSLGAAPTPISWQELYTALQAGVIDGNEQPPYLMRTAKLYEVQKYYTLDGHFLNLVVFMVNEDFFQKLSASDQNVIKYAAKQAQLAFLGIIMAKEAEDLKFLAEKGMKITALTPEEYQMFRDKAQPAVIEELKKKISPAMIDELLKAVEEAEKK